MARHKKNLLNDQPSTHTEEPDESNFLTDDDFFDVQGTVTEDAFLERWWRLKDDSMLQEQFGRTLPDEVRQQLPVSVDDFEEIPADKLSQYADLAQQHGFILTKLYHLVGLVEIADFKQLLALVQRQTAQPNATPKRIGRPRHLTPVNTLIGRRGLHLRENTDLAWPDIAEHILRDLDGQKQRDSVEDDTIQRLTTVLKTLSRDRVGTFIQRVVKDFKTRLKSGEQE